METGIVSVQTIESVRPHRAAETLDICKLKERGEQVICGRAEFQPGDSVLYFEVGALLPKRLQDRLGVASKLGGKKKSRVGKRTIQGERSEGLLAPVSVIEKLMAQRDSFPPPDEIKRHLGVLSPRDAREEAAITEWKRGLKEWTRKLDKDGTGWWRKDVARANAMPSQVDVSENESGEVLTIKPAPVVKWFMPLEPQVFNFLPGVIIAGGLSILVSQSQQLSALPLLTRAGLSVIGFFLLLYLVISALWLIHSFWLRLVSLSSSPLHLRISVDETSFGVSRGRRQPRRPFVSGRRSELLMELTHKKLYGDYGWILPEIRIKGNIHPKRILPYKLLLPSEWMKYRLSHSDAEKVEHFRVRHRITKG